MTAEKDSHKGQPAQLTRAAAALRQQALAYPQTKEEFPWGHCAIKVKGKIFLSLALIEGVLSLSVKLPLSGRVALTFPFASPTHYGLGKHGWVTARFGADDDIPSDLLEQWLEESFRAVAPKKVLAQLEGAEADGRPGSSDLPPSTKTKRGKKSK